MKKSYILWRPDKVLWVFQTDKQLHQSPASSPTKLGYIKLYINHVAGEFLEYVAQGGIEYAYRQLSINYQTNIQEVKNTFKAFLQELEKVYHFNIHNYQSYKWTIKGSKNTYLPIHIAIELTNFCNLSCKHCYNLSGPDKNHFIDFDSLKTFVDKSVNEGVLEFELTGGEPSAHPQFIEIVEYIAKKDIFSLAILTNGTLWKKDWLEKLLPYKDKIVIQVDLHSLNQSYVSWFTGETYTLERQKTFIETLASYGFTFRIVAIITPFSVDDIENIVNYAKQHKSSSVGISIVSPVGRATQYKDMLIFNQNNITSYIEIYERVKSQYGVFMYDLRDIQQGENINCGVGNNLTITPTFDVKICTMSNIHLGNLHDFHLSLEEYLRNIPLSEVLQQTPAPTPDICKDCPDMGFCGGCITRGIMKAKEQPNKCNYIQTAGKELWDIITHYGRAIYD